MDKYSQQQLIEAAILAPSGDNSQPWLYHWKEEFLELWIDQTRSGGFSDQRFILSDLAIGACIENIVIRAHSMGYSTQIQYLPDLEQKPLYAAKLGFSPSPKQDALLALAIPERHTDRSFPWKGPITSTTKQAICDECAKLPGVTLTWLDGTPLYKSALKAIWLAESLRFSCKELHRELFSSIHFDISNTSSCEEGLASTTLAIESPLIPVFKLMQHWPVMRALNWIGSNYLIGFRSAIVPILLSPGLSIISIKETSRTDIINAGRALQRAWLKATESGLSIHPFAAAGVLTLGNITGTHRHNQRQLMKIESLLKRVCCGNQGVIFFRVGTSSNHQVQRNGRRNAPQFNCISQPRSHKRIVR